MLTPKRMMPMHVSIEAMPVQEGHAHLTVAASSNEGWYAMQVTPLARPLYQRAFAGLFQAVNAAVASIVVGD
jgi:hypothetical protein